MKRPERQNLLRFPLLSLCRAIQLEPGHHCGQSACVNNSANRGETFTKNPGSTGRFQLAVDDTDVERFWVEESFELARALYLGLCWWAKWLPMMPLDNRAINKA